LAAKWRVTRPLGGKARDMHNAAKARKIRAACGSDGMVERDGVARAIHVGKRSKPVPQKHIRENVEAQSAIFTDWRTSGAC